MVPPAAALIAPTMKSLQTRECIEAKARIFPQEADEYFQCVEAVNTAKTRPVKSATKATLKVKCKELKELYKELEYMRYPGDSMSNYRHVTYQKLAIQLTYKSLIERRVSILNARLQIARMLNDIDKSWKKLAYYYYTFGWNQKPYIWSITFEDVTSWPGLIGFPDPYVDASPMSQNTESKSQAAL